VKFYWILFILLLSACNQVDEKQGDNSNLESFREWRVGNFHYSDGAFKYLIHRTSAYQEEFLLQEGLLVRFSINWENDSVYVMHFDSILSNPNQTELAFDINQIQKTCTMTEVNSHSYVERSVNNLNDIIDYTQIIRNQRD
jgi:hypothetical protein